MGQNLFNKVWDLHRVTTLDNGQDQLFIGLHLIHEVTSPQAFAMLSERELSILYPERTIATVDHIVPTASQERPFADKLAEKMMSELEENTARHGIRFFDITTDFQGIVHVIGPELGLTQPGMTIACGDSHTSTHGAFGSIGFGIGTSQIRDIFASQCIAISRPKVRKIDISGSLGHGVYAKDIILRLIAELGVFGGLGYAYEYNGDAIAKLSMEERMTICNMSIEGGARVGYVNPDETTYQYMQGRQFAPHGKARETAMQYWHSIRSDDDAEYDEIYTMDASQLEPMITWGINPGQAIPISSVMPRIEELPEEERENAELAYSHMKFTPGTSLIGTEIDVAFLGSCTNSRISDLREAARIVEGKRTHPRVEAFVVPGSKQVAIQAKKEGLVEIFEAAGFQWRGAGCSMCLGMNPDQLTGSQLCASSSNRNFIGRQGSPTGRTLLMSPAMVMAAAINGAVTDVREIA